MSSYNIPSNIPSGSGNFVPLSSPRKAGTCPTIDLDALAERKKFHWDSAKTKHFLEAMVEEIQSEGRGLLSFTKASWKRIIGTMFGRIGEWLTPKQCANKYTELKNYWKAWNLLELDRSQTGFGRDPDTGAITMPEHQWQQLIRRNKFVKKFRDRPLEHAQLMDFVFRKVTTRGKAVWTANGDNPDHQEGSSSETESVLKIVPRSGSSSRKRKGSVSDAISQSIDNLIDSCKLSKVQVSHQDPMVDATALVQGMDFFKQTDNKPLKWWALNLLEANPGKRGIFIGLGTTVDRIEWLEREHSMALATFNQSGAPFGPHAPPLYFPPPPYE